MLCCRKVCRIFFLNLLLIYSFSIKNLYSYLYILQKQCCQHFLIKAFSRWNLVSVFFPAVSKVTLWAVSLNLVVPTPSCAYWLSAHDTLNNSLNRFCEWAVSCSSLAPQACGNKPEANLLFYVWPCTLLTSHNTPRFPVMWEPGPCLPPCISSFKH